MRFASAALPTVIFWIILPLTTSLQAPNMPAGLLEVSLDKLQLVKRSINSCQFYKSPTPGQKFNTSTPSITFSWNTKCFQSPVRYVNIMLLSPAGPIFEWANVDAGWGSYQTELKSEWLGSASNMTLQLGITASDTPLFLSPFVAGPVFTLHNSNPSPSQSRTGTSTAPATTSVLRAGYLDVSKFVLSRGGLAAAILFPILIALGAILGYIWFSRKREAQRRAQWLENVDKRMSTISGDWQSLSHPGVRNSMHSSRRTPRPSVHSRNMSMLGGGARASVATDLEARNRATLVDRRSFAVEDDTQLGPRGRALSAAAAEGRPLSSLIAAEKDLPLPPNGRTRSKSTAADGGVAAGNAMARTNYTRTPHSRTRTTSTASNNPYAKAMAQRDSLAISPDEKALPFPPSTSPLSRPRLHSNGRSMDIETRSRVISHVSFADAPRPSEDRRRHMAPEKRGMRPSARENSGGDDFAIDFGDAFPALALMRVKSGDGPDGVAFPSDEIGLTPTREFIPPTNQNDYFEAMPDTGLGGRTPDEILKAYASAKSNNHVEEQERSPGLSGTVFASVKRMTGLWRK